MSAAPTALCRLPKRRGGIASAVLLVLALVVATLAVTATAQTIDDYPPVACPAEMTNCLECRNTGIAYICSNCAAGYSTSVDYVNSPSTVGKCVAYDSTKCTLDNCVRCAADDGTKCVQCPAGYPDINTYVCEQTTTSTSTTTTSTATPTTTTTSTTNPDSSHSSPSTSNAPTTTPTTTPAPTTSTTTSTSAAPTTSSPTSAPTTTRDPNCQVPSCVTCQPGNPYSCATCMTGMIVATSGQCMMPGSCSVANCAACYPSDNNRCSSCNANYALTASYACVPVRSNAAGTPASAALMAVVVGAAAAVANFA